MKSAETCETWGLILNSLPSSIAGDIQNLVACIACGESAAQVFFQLDDVPVLCNAPCATREDALAFPKGLITLAFCRNCGHVFNSSFAPERMLYNQQYENSLHYSPLFDRYIHDLGRDLVSRFQLREKNVIEIGCGKGDFLALLCRLGSNRGIGFDPSYEPGRMEDDAGEHIHIIRDLYAESYGHLACDLLCCRQTLEHISDPASFLDSIRRSLGESHKNTPVFFEVPNALYTLQHKGVWDIIYEHVSYFWSVPLAHLFHRSGFAVTRVEEAFGGQYLCLEAIQGQRPKDDLQQLLLARVTEDVRLFADAFRATLQDATAVLEDVTRRSGRAVVWGAGSKGVTFLNLFRKFDIAYAVDVNPHKQGKFVPGTSCLIVQPEFLAEYQPDVVFLMNPLYREEIAGQLASLAPQAKLLPV